MQEQRATPRFRVELNVRWETLRSQGRGTVCDLSSDGCFVLTGGQFVSGELVRLQLMLPNEVVVLWGHVVYQVAEIGFALRFAGPDENPGWLERLTAGEEQEFI